MKKFLLILLVSIMMLSSCAKTAEISGESGISRYSGETKKDETELTYPAYYVRTDDYSNDSYTEQGPLVTVINSREELEKYTSDNENIYDFVTHTHSIGFYDAVTKYDAEFFEKSSLVMILLHESSPSYTHGNRGFTKNDSGYSINLIRFTHDSNEFGAAEWHIIFEIPKNSPILASDKLKVEIREEKTDS